MKIIKKLMQIALVVFFFSLLATSSVLADDADSEGWQYIPAPHKGVTIGSSLRQDVTFRPDWFYFSQDGVLQEFVGK